MSYHIPSTGSLIENPRGPWYLGHFDVWVTYMVPAPYRLWETLTPVPEIDINQFAGAVVSHQTRPIHPDGMGCFSSASVVRTETNQLYLQVPQTGCCVYYRLHES